ncbi:hypothetical protein C8Q79DRAFT_1005878 [Trametes meyenii]|nr:hypothetical protein C8Q79DRAFT_1005878 [Trametes meyenii]
MSPDYEEFATTQRRAVMDVDEASDSDSFYTADGSPSPFPSPNISSSSTLPTTVPTPSSASSQSYQNSPSGLTDIMSSVELAPTPAMSSVAPPSYHNLPDTSPAPSYSSHPALSPRTSTSSSHASMSASSMLSPIPLPFPNPNTLGLNVMSPTTRSGMSASMDDNDATPRIPRRITVPVNDRGHRRRTEETEGERRTDHEIRSVRRIVEVDESATLRERVMVLMNDITTLQNAAIAEQQRLSESQDTVIRLQRDIATMRQSFEAEVARRCAEREGQLEQVALARTEQGCRDKQDELAIAAASLEKERKEWDKRISIERADLDAAKHELTQQQSDLEERGQKLEAELEECRRKLEAELEEHRQKLEADQSQHEATLHSQSSELNERLAAVAMEREKMVRERDALDRAQSQMAQERVVLEKKLSQVEQGRQEVAEARIQVDQTRLETEKARNEIEADRAKLRTRVSQMEKSQRPSSSTSTPPAPPTLNSPSRSRIASSLSPSNPCTSETLSLKPRLASTRTSALRKSPPPRPSSGVGDVSSDNDANPPVGFIAHKGKAPSRQSHGHSAPVYPPLEHMDLDYPDTMDMMPGSFLPPQPPLQLQQVARRAVYRWASPEILRTISSRPAQRARQATEMLDEAPFRISDDNSDEDDHAMRVTRPAVVRAAAAPSLSKPGPSKGGYEDDEEEVNVVSLLGVDDQDQIMEDGTAGSEIHIEDDGDDESSDAEVLQTNKFVGRGGSHTKPKRSNLPDKVNVRPMSKKRRLTLHSILREVLRDRYNIDNDMDWCQFVPATNEEVEAYEDERGPGPSSVTRPYIDEGWRRKRWNLDIFNTITAEFIKECEDREVQQEADILYTFVVDKCEHGFRKWRMSLARPGETTEEYIQRNTDQYNAELSRARTNTNRRNKYK